MNILYINYWGIEDGLTASTVFPHLEILSRFENVTRIHFVTVERSDGQTPAISLPSKTIHHPIKSANLRFNFINKINDIRIIKTKLRQIVDSNELDLIQCKGALAGALGYQLFKWSKIPFCVESFEPHADYMLESKVWKKYDPRYLFQKHWEKKQRQHARMLMTVSNNYRTFLIESGLSPNTVEVMPCAVDSNVFAFSPGSRDQIRKRLGLEKNHIVGIYVGKFGGIYMDGDAFKLFRRMFEMIPDFRLIILTPDPMDVEKSVLEENLDLSKCFIDKVDHSEVAAFLSASEIALSTIKPAPVRKYCSPVKNGEYWANGLPILLPQNIGDDSQIIEQSGYGAIFDPLNPDEAITEILSICKDDRQELSTRIARLAKENRTFATSKMVYEKLIKSIQKLSGNHN